MNDSRMQAEIFSQSEGDRWYQRARTTLPNAKGDPVLVRLSTLCVEATSVLEIGASNGWRLTALKAFYPHARLCGLEPSTLAIQDAALGLEMKQGTAERIPWDADTFDLVIFGMCLNCCDRSDLFLVASEANRVLKDRGHIIIYDFHVSGAYRNANVHHEGLHTYKQDYGLMFSWNPAYRVVAQTLQLQPGVSEDKPDNYTAVTILCKDLSAGWPDNPNRR
jgi:ubiquinone/menaquinone biosynthesis C-methylase UbiE